MARSSSKHPRGGAAQFIVRPLFAALVASGVIASGGLHAATIVVTTGGDAGNAGTCTLRQAVDAMNTANVAGTGCVNSGGAFGTGDTVDLTGLSGTITLAGASVIEINVSLAIQGPGSTALTVSGANASRVFVSTPAFPAILRIDDLTIASGRAGGPGGCVLVENELRLTNAVVTGCTAVHDPVEYPSYLSGIGGGVAASVLLTQTSTISGNTAENAGGGVFAKYSRHYGSSISGNTVTGRACDTTSNGKYCLPTFLGGGGILGGSVQLFGSTVSGNTVHASAITGTSGEGTTTYLVGLGGGISQWNKYGEEVLAKAGAGAKGTITGRFDPSARAAARQAFRASAGSFAAGAAGARAKAGARVKGDGVADFALGMVDSTLSGNRITGSGAFDAKYLGGGAIAYSEYYNAEISNSTISGNSLGNGAMYTVGSALFVDSVELSNSTITGNTGTVAVAIKYQLNTAVAATSKAAGAKARLDAIRARVAQVRGAANKAGNPAVSKADAPSTFASTIIGGNAAKYDAICSSSCTIGGSNNLVQTYGGMTLPGDTIVGQNPQLSPLGNFGGQVAGAPGHPGTGPVRTHLLYIGSPAIDAGANPEGFEYEQRGEGFPRVVGLFTDIGATEGAIVRPVIATVPVPALGPWMLGLLSALLGALGLARRRRKS
jgi:hypothetical protein